MSIIFSTKISQKSEWLVINQISCGCFHNIELSINNAINLIIS